MGPVSYSITLECPMFRQLLSLVSIAIIITLFAAFFLGRNARQSRARSAPPVKSSPVASEPVTENPDPAPVVAKSPAMRKETYSQCQTGMTYSEVIAIVGPPDEELSQSSIGGIETAMYQWRGGIVANANMTFQDGVLVTKAQFGL